MVHLTSLNLSTNNIGNSGIIALANAFKKLPRLTSFNFGHNKIEIEGITALAEGIKDLPHLTSLDLEENGIGEEGFIPLAKNLEGAKNLTYLNLGKNNIGAKVVRILKTLPNLISLNLEENNISSEELHDLACFLKNAWHLSKLNLSLNNITSIPQTFLETVKNLRHIKELNFSRNPIGTEGANGILSLLPHLPCLRHLDLSNCHIKSLNVDLLEAGNFQNLTLNLKSNDDLSDPDKEKLLRLDRKKTKFLEVLVY